MSIRQWRKFIITPKGKYRPPLQFVSDYDIRKADMEAKLVMLAGYARSPLEAHKLMDKHHVTTARDLLPLMPPRRTRKNPFRQVARVIMRIDGARRGDVIHHPRKEESQLWLQYRYKGQKDE